MGLPRNVPVIRVLYRTFCCAIATLPFCKAPFTSAADLTVAKRFSPDVSDSDDRADHLRQLYFHLQNEAFYAREAIVRVGRLDSSET
jgi:hypothetical protein